jgi:hypothetical protein
MGLGRTALRLLFRGAISALLITLGVWLFDEIVGQRRREGHVRAKNLERAQEVADAYESELIERDRTVQPGISIRS